MTLRGDKKAKELSCYMSQALNAHVVGDRPTINDSQIRQRAAAVARDNTYINTKHGTIDLCYTSTKKPSL